jgi:predicted TIM-barrel fold metal-dependent hydrolase
VDALASLALVDHHCHGVSGENLDRAEFESFINEGFDRPARGTSHFDTPIGLAVRRWCAPILDLEPFPDPDSYIDRRLDLGADEVNRRFLRSSGLGAALVDTGYVPDGGLGPEEVGELAGAQPGAIFRLESVAEEVAASGVGATEYAHAFADALGTAAERAVGLKTVVAYRGGFGFDPSVPSAQEVEAAAGRWLRATAGTVPRLEDPVLLRHGIWSGAELARDRGFPIQFHAGFGDPDLLLHEANPTLLTSLVRRLGAMPVDVVFLHCYPYHREAGYLAAMFPNVYLDVGSILHYTGPSSGRILAEALELAPFTKHLYASDAFGAAELFYLGALLFRRGLGATLDAWIQEDHCSTTEAERIAELIGRGNAVRIYPLDGDT